MKSSTLAAAVVAVLLFGSLFVGSALAAQSTPTDLPEESEVGTDFEAEFELDDLFSEFETWRFVAETELENATWTITQYNQAGSEVSRTETDGANATQAVDIDDGTSTLEVRVTGTTPEIETFSYDPPDRFVVANFTQEREGGTDRDIATHQSHHYTEESKEARQAIDRASEAVEGSTSDDAQSSLNSAISAYESGNFGNAIDLAERAESEAERSQLLRNALIGIGIIVVLVLVLGGGYKVYKSRQKGPSRLK